MTGTREEFLEWDALMADVGVPKERYTSMRAVRFARLIFNSTPVHLTLNEWRAEIDTAIHRLLEQDLKQIQ